MKRRTFIKSSSLAGIAVSLVPVTGFTIYDRTIPYQELIGKGDPRLFGDGYKLRKEAYEAFTQMSNAALESDISIEVVSSYRSYAHQNRIWSRKYEQNLTKGLSPEASIQKIIEYSTIPGTSRHHWGTDLDIIDGNAERPRNVLNPSHFGSNGTFGKLKSWMDKNANDFGFYLVYTNSDGRKGFKYEPWHYSYKPLSKSYLNEYLKLDLKTIITSEKLLGNAHFSNTFIDTYLRQNILDINPELL